MSWDGGLDYFDQFRIEIAGPDPALPNLIENPSGHFGAWGWLTPLAGTNAYSNADPYGDGKTPSGGTPWIVVRSDAGVHPQVHSTKRPMKPGRHVRGRFQRVSGELGTSLRARVDFYDQAGAYLSSSAWSAYANTQPAIVRTPSVVAPANTAWAALRIDMAGSNGAALAAGVAKVVMFSDAMLTWSAAAIADTFAYAEPITWLDITGPSTRLQVDRKKLDVGLLVANILDASLDPAVSDTIRPGRAVRVLGRTTAAIGPWRHVFRGEVQKADVDYDKRKRSGAGVLKTRISLAAVDNGQRLANQPEPRGVRTTPELPAILEDKSVPWLVHGSNDQRDSFTVVSLHDRASALDQVAMTADTNHDHAYVNGAGVLVVTDVPASSGVSLSDEAAAPLSFTGASVTFATDDLINAVTVKVLRYTAATTTAEAKTEEISYGPFADQESVLEWGVHPSTFTVQGDDLDSAAAAEAWAQEVLDANAQPAVKVRSLQIKVDSTAVLEAVHAIDLTKTVAVRFQGVDYVARVNTLSHAITPTGWRVTLTFAQDGTVAQPTAVPAPGVDPATLVDTDWLDLTLVNGWINYGSGYAPAQYRRKDGVVYLRGLIVGTARTAPTAFVLPVGFRHDNGTQLWVCSSDSHPGTTRMDSNSFGTVVYVAGGVAFVSLAGISWPVDG